MVLHSRSLIAGAALAIVCFFFGAGASGKDLEMLTRLLIPAYMAQDFAAVCGTRNPHFLSTEAASGATLISDYAEHVKREVTIGIPEDEAQRVRITAADVARQVARHELHLLTANRTTEIMDVVERWCDRSAKPFILEIMSKHQEKHRELDEILENAKR